MRAVRERHEISLPRSGEVKTTHDAVSRVVDAQIALYNRFERSKSAGEPISAHWKCTRDQQLLGAIGSDNSRLKDRTRTNTRPRYLHG